MSTKYNHFAKDLDAAFKAARDEYAAAYNTVLRYIGRAGHGNAAIVPKG